MTAHTCTELTDGCYRCELSRDEMAAIADEARTDAQAAWLTYRDAYARKWRLSSRGIAHQMRRREFIAGYLAAEGVTTHPPTPHGEALRAGEVGK